MMNKLIGLVLKFSGAEAAWKRVDGYKTKIGIVSTALGGLALMFSGSANFLTSLQSCDVLSCVVELIRGHASNLDIKTFGTGLTAFGGALTGLGLVHKGVKTISQPK